MNRVLLTMLYPVKFVIDCAYDLLCSPIVDGVSNRDCLGCVLLVWSSWTLFEFTLLRESKQVSA